MTPVNNTIIVAIVVSILAGFIPLDKLADMVSIGTLTAFIVVSIGVIILRVREPDLPRGFKVPFYYVIRTSERNIHIPIVPVLSVLACGYILYSLHWYTWIAFSAWVVVVVAFYLAWGRHHSALNDGGDGLIPTAAPQEDEVLIHPPTGAS
jgi:APA family basic amino acid/polyamine antiporter